VLSSSYLLVGEDANVSMILILELKHFVLRTSNIVLPDSSQHFTPSSHLPLNSKRATYFWAGLNSKTIK
jgi:hypothetical protein